jgi:UDP-N-acetylmuramate-alanine ligase
MVKGPKLHREHADHFTHSETLIKDLAEFVKRGYGIFVCSDDPEKEKAVMDAYPGSVIRQEKSDDWRTTVNGMHEALVDLCVLAKTKFIVGTGGSQFSELAARLGKIPLYNGTLAPVLS